MTFLSLDFLFSELQSSFDVRAEKADGSIVNLTVNGTVDEYEVWENVSFASSLENVISVTFDGQNSLTQYDNIVVNAVPIPAGVWLFGSGLGLLGWLRRRQTA